MHEKLAPKLSLRVLQLQCSMKSTRLETRLSRNLYVSPQPVNENSKADFQVMAVDFVQFHDGESTTDDQRADR